MVRLRYWQGWKHHRFGRATLQILWCVVSHSSDWAQCSNVVSASPGVVKPKQSSATFENLQVLPLSHPALIRYLQDRCIDIEVAKSVCKEVHYRSTTNVILLLAFRTVVVVMSCAILSSRVALHRKTSAISMPTSQRRYVFFSRALLIFSHSWRLGESRAHNIMDWVIRTIWYWIL